MKKISFIIPVFNCDRYLESCIENIFCIGLSNYEVILVDDGSTDDSYRICRELSHNYSQIVAIHQENRGAASARNRGIMQSKGKFIVFLDADDSFDSNGLSELLARMDFDESIDVAIYGMTFDYYKNGICYRSDDISYPLPGLKKEFHWRSELSDMYDSNALSSVCNKVFRKDIIDRERLLFNEKMFIYEDLEFFLRYLSFCKNIYMSSECIYHYRQSEDEGNAGRRLKRIEKLTEVVDHIEAALDELIIAQKIDDQSQKIKSILLELYCVIAREKIAIASRKEIGKICVDFADWMSKRDVVVPEKHVAFINMIIQKKVSSFVWQRRYTRCRHKIAVWIKSTMIYRKFHEKR